MTRVLPFLADDCVYRMTETAPPANGHDGIIQRLKPTIDNATLVEFADCGHAPALMNAEQIGMIRDWLERTAP